MFAPSLRYPALAAQLAGVAATLLWLVAAPPARGTVWLVPLVPGARPVQSAMAQEMQVVASGPFASVIARAGAGRDDLSLLRQGVIVLAAPAALCGGAA